MIDGQCQNMTKKSINNENLKLAKLELGQGRKVTECILSINADFFNDFLDFESHLKLIISTLYISSINIKISKDKENFT